MRLWSRVFGRNNVIVRAYEKQQLPEGIIPNFLQLIGHECTEGYLFPEKTVNPSLGRRSFEFLRLANEIDIPRELRVRLVECVSSILDGVDERVPFEDHALLSPNERIELLEEFKSSNAQVASEFLGRSDGKLFYDPWPLPDESWRPRSNLAMSDLVKIMVKLWVEQMKSTSREGPGNE